MSLTFNPKIHRYRMDGKHVTGVTTLIKGGVPAPALVYWASRSVAEWVADNGAHVETLRGMWRGPMIAALKDVPWAALDKAGARGTEVHDLGENLVHGLEVEVPEHLTGYVEGYARFLDMWQPTPILTECSVGNREHWYAGRFDLVADLDGVRWLLDLKTAKGVYGDNALQCDAYRNAEFYVVDGDPETELPMPEGIERLGVIHIREDGSDLVPLESNGQPFRDFLHAAYTSKREKIRKAYVGEPMTHPSQAEGAA